MIPKLLHHLWIDPLNLSHNLSTIPEDARVNLRSWSSIETTYAQKVWLLEEILTLCQANNLPLVANAISLCRFPSMQADIVRLLLLHLFGGFWADLKLFLNIRFLDRLVEYDLIVTEHFPKEDLPHPNGRLSNSFIGAAPGNFIIAKSLQNVINNVFCRKSGSIYHITGATNLEQSIFYAEDPGEYFMLPHKTAWNYLFTIGSGSYNGENMHWSLREQRECPFVN